MNYQSSPVSGTTNIALADELGLRLPTASHDSMCLEVSRDFVSKVVEAARHMVVTPCESACEMVRLAYHIEATQKNLEKLYDDGLGSTEESSKLLTTIVDMAQKFLSCHKKVCQEVYQRALSSDR